jgi:two-component system phosphate regulon sensor histidine kinase PhoR
MKLWIKVSLIAIIMVTAATGICSLVMLMRSGQSNLDLAVDNALTAQELRAASWANGMNASLDDADNARAQRSLARYLIGQYADSGTVLISGDDFIYNAISIDPTAYLRISDSEQNQQYILQDIGGKTFLIAGSHLDINQVGYTLYAIRDVSSVYEGIRELAMQFSLINLAVIAAFGVLVILLVRLVLRPIATLKKNTSLIANGIYDKRIDMAERDEIGELAGDFNIMAAAIERHIQKLKDEAERRTMFMSALTHELKTPMTSISGNAQTLLRTKLSDEERDDALMRIDDECNRIERLSQKMMQLIVLRQNDNIALTPQSVSDLLETVRVLSAEQLLRRGLTLTIENSMDTLPMDTDLMSSLLLNLIDNAGKASKPGGCIALCANGNTICVQDHGKGIPEAEIAKIMQPFYMVDKSRSKKAGGIGLGLALCEEIARLHGAHLEIESAENRGTTVRVVFEHV